MLPCKDGYGHPADTPPGAGDRLPAVSHHQLAAEEVVLGAAVGPVEATGDGETVVLHAQAEFDHRAGAVGPGQAVVIAGDGLAVLTVELVHGVDRALRRTDDPHSDERRRGKNDAR